MSAKRAYRPWRAATGVREKFVRRGRVVRFKFVASIDIMVEVSRVPLTTTIIETDAGDWLVRFHAGEQRILEACYREHFQTVFRAVGQILSGADQETLTHEVFYRLLVKQDFRRSFQGGSLGAWLATVARNQAIDFRRRRDREQPTPAPAPDEGTSFTEAADARLEIERFRRDVLPAKWVRVFEVRFLEQLDQREAARRLGISRTTLAYQELRVRSLLQKYLLVRRA
jgi:RNA polymerase sigma-70 factor, ECF subfamily